MCKLAREPASMTDWIQFRKHPFYCKIQGKKLWEHESYFLLMMFFLKAEHPNPFHESVMNSNTPVK